MEASSWAPTMWPLSLYLFDSAAPCGWSAGLSASRAIWMAPRACARSSAMSFHGRRVSIAMACSSSR